MATDYTETESDPDDVEGKVLSALADGMPYAFVVATGVQPLTLRVATGNSVETLRALLKQTLKALPDED